MPNSRLLRQVLMLHGWPCWRLGPLCWVPGQHQGRVHWPACPALALPRGWFLARSSLRRWRLVKGVWPAANWILTLT